MTTTTTTGFGARSNSNQPFNAAKVQAKQPAPKSNPYQNMYMPKQPSNDVVQEKPKNM